MTLKTHYTETKRSGLQETVNFKVYAVGYILDGEYGYFYGPESLKSFVELFMKNPNKILCAYNGSRFDFILLLKELLNNHNVEIGGLITSEFPN